MTGLLYNQLAPSWQHETSLLWDTPKGYRDVFQRYVFSIAATDTTPTIGQRLALDRDADFIWRELRFQYSAAFTATPAIRFRLPAGEYLSNDFLRMFDIQGPYPYPEAILQAGSFLLTDLRILDPGGAGTVTVQVILAGRKRYRLL